MGRGIGRRLVAAAVREMEEETRWQGDRSSKENQAPKPSGAKNQASGFVVPNGKPLDQPLEMVTGNANPPMRSNAVATKQPRGVFAENQMLQNYQGKRAGDNLVYQRMAKKAMITKDEPVDDIADGPVLAPFLPKDESEMIVTQMHSFSRWFAEKYHKRFEFKTESINKEKGKMALVCIPASPDYLAGALWCGQSPLLGSVDALPVLGLRINYEGQITIVGGETVRDIRVSAELLHDLVAPPKRKDEVAKFTTIEEWKAFVKETGPKYSDERLSESGGKVAHLVLDEVPVWLQGKED